MIRTLFLVGFLLFSPAAWCQKTETDTQTMQAVLLEIRQLRHDLQTAATAARRAQIVIFRMHEQEMIVERATTTLENTRTVLAGMAGQREYEEMQIKQTERMKDRADSEEKRKQLEDFLADTRERLAEMATAEQECEAKELEEESDLRAARGKLEQFENELDQLEIDLEQTAVRASAR